MPEKIDSHIHFWELSRGDYYWLSADMKPLQRDFCVDDFAALARDNNVGGAVLVQAAPTAAETRYLLDTFEQSGLVAAIIGRVHIEDPAIALAELDEFCEHSLFRGIRPMLRNMAVKRWLEQPGLDATVRELIHRGLTFECMVRPEEYSELRAWLERYPDLRAVLSHAGMPDIAGADFAGWSSAMAQLAETTGLYCKLSGLTTLAAEDWNRESLRPYVEHLVSCFGPQRLIWGSDWPVMLCAGSYAGWCSACDSLLAPLEAQAQAAIYSENAVKFYDLGAG